MAWRFSNLRCHFTWCFLYIKNVIFFCLSFELSQRRRRRNLLRKTKPTATAGEPPLESVVDDDIAVGIADFDCQNDEEAKCDSSRSSEIVREIRLVRYNYTINAYFKLPSLCYHSFIMLISF